MTKKPSVKIVFFIWSALPESVVEAVQWWFSKRDWGMIGKGNNSVLTRKGSGVGLSGMLLQRVRTGIMG